MSPTLKNYLIEKHAVNEGKIFVNASSSTKDFIYDGKLRENKRKELYLADSDVVMVFSSGGSANWQNYEMVIKYSRRIAKNIYSVTTDPEMILDRYFDKGDMINIIVSKHGAAILNKAAYVVVSSQDLVLGYRVIQERQVQQGLQVQRDLRDLRETQRKCVVLDFKLGYL